MTSAIKSYLTSDNINRNIQRYDVLAYAAVPMAIILISSPFYHILPGNNFTRTVSNTGSDFWSYIFENIMDPVFNH